MSSESHMKDMEIICRDVLTGKELAEDAILFFGSTEQKIMDFYRAASNLNIEIRSRHVMEMLKKFIKGDVTVEYLKEWALFILMTGAFGTPDYMSDRTFRYDPMWTILGMLSAPEIDGRVTPKIAHKYIEELWSIKEDR